MKIRREIVVGITLALVVFITSCAAPAQGQPPAQDATLKGTEWVLNSLNGNALIEDKQITLRFGDTSIEGFGGCNAYGGSYTAVEGNLNLNDVYWTEMACMEPEGILDQEISYFDAFNTVARYLVVQDQDGEDLLELYDETEAQILVFAASSSETLAVEGMPPVITEELSLDCNIEMDQSYSVGESVDIRFVLRNQTGRPLYILSWYTPLEGMAGNIFQVTRDGEKLPYEGMLVKRGDPTREAYVLLEPGKDVSALVNLRTGYDLSAPGSYQVQFTTGLQEVTDDESLLPRIRENHQPRLLSCNTISFQIVPAPEPVTPIPKFIVPPAGFQQYLDTDSGVSLWVPENWTIVKSGLQSGLPDGTTRLQSYPEDKYVGGEPRQPGDTKCDLTIHPPDISVVNVIQQLRSSPRNTIISEQEIVLQSGKSGIRFEVESMGRSNALVTEVNGRVIVLTCFGDFTQFDEIAVTLSAVE